VGLGQNLGQDAGAAHGAHRRRRIGRGQQLQQLLGHPLDRQPDHAGRQRRARLHRRRAGPAATVPGVEAEKAQDAQVVFLDPPLRRADEDDPAGQRIGQPVPRRIEDFARPVGVEGVDAKVAPRRVLAPVVGEGDRGITAVRRDVAAKSGDLETPAAGHRRHRAVLNARRHGAQARGLNRLDHIGGEQSGGDVDVVDRLVHQAVADAAADEAGAVRPPRYLQRIHDLDGRRRGQPGFPLKPCGHAASSATAAPCDASFPYSLSRSARRIPAVTPQM